MDAAITRDDEKKSRIRSRARTQLSYEIPSTGPCTTQENRSSVVELWQFRF